MIENLESLEELGSLNTAIEIGQEPRTTRTETSAGPRPTNGGTGSSTTASRRGVQPLDDLLRGDDGELANGDAWRPRSLVVPAACAVESGLGGVRSFSRVQMQ